MTLIPTLNAPTTGDPRVPAPLVENDNAIRTVVNGGLDNSNLSGSAGITDANLASPNNSVYRTLLRAAGGVRDADAAATYALGTMGSVSGISSSPFTAGSSGIFSNPVVAIYLDDADFTVAGKTTKLRVRAHITPNATVPAITFTIGLYPVTMTGAADTLTATLGTVVASSTAVIASPSASTTTSAVSSDINVPADGLYMLGVVTSGTVTANSVASIGAELQVRHT